MTLTTLSIGEVNTVIAEYKKTERDKSYYESEWRLENDFIEKLQSQGYQFIDVHDEDGLVKNLREQINRLNNIVLTDNEWNHFFHNVLSKPGDGVIEKAKLFQNNHIHTIERDNGESKNIMIVDKKNLQSNRLQVINQYESEGSRKTRLDVTILINGLPIVHVELKKRDVAIKEAFNQIKRYNRDSFWAGSGLFNFIQIFVISNGTETKYYANTTRKLKIHEINQSSTKKDKMNRSFEFTSYWTDAKNNQINELSDFTETFFAKNTLLKILTKFCVLNVKDELLVMRPYQIAATEAILNQIRISLNQKSLGTIAACGYVWHTTGSGKTLTSFKTGKLIIDDLGAEKVIFAVDRKDLDDQSIKEFKKFEANCVDMTTSTRKLEEKISNNDSKFIVTTIQKLSRLVKKHKNHKIYGKHIVVIMDECQRSQFGEMRESITDAFTQYNMFGFTGTPIFVENSNASNGVLTKTTEQIFGKRLHTYTIVNAIRDKNVLPFRIDTIETMRAKDEIDDDKIAAVDKTSAYDAKERIERIVSYIIRNFKRKTDPGSKNQDKNPSKTAFNSMFATSSIDAAKLYYNEFKRQQEKLPVSKRLKIGIIYSYAANENIDDDGTDDEEDLSAENMQLGSRDFLESAIEDYNQMFDTNFSTDAEKFSNYYRDISEKTKERKIDILIVVNMFLTGFDAPRLNTLWVDKNLKDHSLIQAFSRTNRIFNENKSYGNIVCFRNLEKEINDAIKLFADEDAKSVVILKPFEHYFSTYYKKVEELVTKYQSVDDIFSEKEKRNFIALFGTILSLRSKLSCFDEFEGNELMLDGQFQEYKGIYSNLYQEMRVLNGRDKEPINEDIVFEIELLKQIDVNVSYIIDLLKKYARNKDNEKGAEDRIKIINAVESSLELRSKKELIHEFIDQVSDPSRVGSDWIKFVDQKKKEELDSIIKEESLKEAETLEHVDQAFKNGIFRTSGSTIDNLMLKKGSMFGQSADYTENTRRVTQKLSDFFEKYKDR